MASARWKMPEYKPGPFRTPGATMLAYRRLAKDYLRWAREAESSIQEQINVGRPRSSPLLKKWRREADTWRRRARQALALAKKHVVDKRKVDQAVRLYDQGLEMDRRAYFAKDPAEMRDLYERAADAFDVAADAAEEANDVRRAAKYREEARRSRSLTKSTAQLLQRDPTRKTSERYDFKRRTWYRKDRRRRR